MSHVLRSTPDSSDLVIATLHKLGRRVQFERNTDLAACFDAAADANPTVFGQFTCHPQYHDCPHLTEILTTCFIANDIVAGTPIWTYRVGPHLLGKYGKRKYKALPPEIRAEVDRIAKRIQETFRLSRNKLPRADGFPFKSFAGDQTTKIPPSLVAGGIFSFSWWAIMGSNH